MKSSESGGEIISLMRLTRIFRERAAKRPLERVYKMLRNRVSEHARFTSTISKLEKLAV